MSSPKEESVLIELGKASEETKINGYPKETRDNLCTRCKGPWVG